MDLPWVKLVGEPDLPGEVDLAADIVLLGVTALLEDPDVRPVVVVALSFTVPDFATERVALLLGVLGSLAAPLPDLPAGVPFLPEEEASFFLGTSSPAMGVVHRRL